MTDERHDDEQQEETETAVHYDGGDDILEPTGPIVVPEPIAPEPPADATTSWTARVLARPIGSTDRPAIHTLPTTLTAGSREEAEQQARQAADLGFEHVQVVNVIPAA
jgi:hypothetical protein